MKCFKQVIVFQVKAACAELDDADESKSYFGREGYNAGVSEADRETRNVMVAGAVRHG